MSINQIARQSIAVGVLGTLAIAVSGVGIAAAANGGSLRLGHHNSATKTTTLSDRKGTPLSLKAGHGKPPLAVNSSKQVKHLNASLLGGSSAGQLATSGSGAHSDYGVFDQVTITDTYSTVAATGKLKAGVYYVTGTATVNMPSGDVDSHCALTTTPTVEVDAQSETNYVGITTLTETGVYTVKAGQKVSEVCAITGGTDTAGAGYFAGITAIRVAHSVPGTVATSHFVPPFVRHGSK